MFFTISHRDPKEKLTLPLKPWGCRFDSRPCQTTLCPWARHLLASGECPCTYCKSLWIRASAKWQSVNVGQAVCGKSLEDHKRLQPPEPWASVPAEIIYHQVDGIAASGPAPADYMTPSSSKQSNFWTVDRSRYIPIYCISAPYLSASGWVHILYCSHNIVANDYIPTATCRHATFVYLLYIVHCVV